MKTILISIILPIYNEEQIITELYGRIKKVIANTLDSYEIIFVDDGSMDHSLEIIDSIIQQDPSVKAISLSRNFGQQHALTAGIDLANGDAVIIMDADLQHPPELIPTFIERWKEGYDIVYAIRQKNAYANPLTRLTSYLFYKTFNKFSEVTIPAGVGNFRLMSKAVIHSVRNCKERVRHLVGIVSWVGYKSIGVPYEADARLGGKTKYNFLKRLRLGIASITSFSSAPLYMSTFVGLIISSFAFLYILYALYMKFFTDKPISGWASILISVLFLGGIQLIAVGILGEYIGRIYEEVKQRPVYLIKKIIENDKSAQ